jgi:hypothetical protein
MNQAQEQQALKEIYAQVPEVSPSDIELLDMFEKFLANQKQEEEIPTLPRGFGQ